MFCARQEQGWTWRGGKGTGEYSPDGDRIFYTGISLNKKRSYLQALVQSPSSFASGVPAIKHGQPEKYYTTMIKLFEKGQGMPLSWEDDHEMPVPLEDADDADHRGW